MRCEIHHQYATNSPLIHRIYNQLSRLFNIRQCIFFAIRSRLVVAAGYANGNYGGRVTHQIEVGKWREIVLGIGALGAGGDLDASGGIAISIAFDVDHCLPSQLDEA